MTGRLHETSTMLSSAANSREEPVVLLRRIIGHVNGQNWFAVCIDFVIVVIGVFVGIQVSNWNDTQGAQRLGYDYTKRIIGDLERDLEYNTTVLNYYYEVLDSVKEADRLLSSVDPDPRRLVVAAYRASEMNNNTSDRATWGQIVASGHIGLLPTSAIESGLSEYYKYQDPIDASNLRLLDSHYRHLVRSLLPIALQAAIRESCSDIVDDVGNPIGFVTECVMDVERRQLEEAAKVLVASPSLHDGLREQYSRVAFMTINYEANILLLKRILDALRTVEET